VAQLEKEDKSTQTESYKVNKSTIVDNSLLAPYPKGYESQTESLPSPQNQGGDQIFDSPSVRMRMLRTNNAMQQTSTRSPLRNRSSSPNRNLNAQ
jgi:hypothetical protein